MKYSPYLASKLIITWLQQKLKLPKKLIVEHLENNGQKLNWLASQCGVSVSHLHFVLKGKDGVKGT